MNINGKEIRYRIEPMFGKVYAEVFYIYKFANGEETEISMISKSFKAWFKPIQDSDYEKAKEWCVFHIVNIKNNKL